MPHNPKILTVKELVARSTWEELLDKMDPDTVNPTEFYKLAQEKVRAYVKTLETRVGELELHKAEVMGVIADLRAENEKLSWMLEDVLRSGINAIAKTREREEEMRQEIVSDRMARQERRWTAREEAGDE